MDFRMYKGHFPLLKFVYCAGEWWLSVASTHSNFRIARSNPRLRFPSPARAPMLESLLAYLWLWCGVTYLFTFWRSVLPSLIARGRAGDRVRRERGGRRTECAWSRTSRDRVVWDNEKSSSSIFVISNWPLMLMWCGINSMIWFPVSTYPRMSQVRGVIARSDPHLGRNLWNYQSWRILNYKICVYACISVTYFKSNRFVFVLNSTSIRWTKPFIYFLQWNTAHWSKRSFPGHAKSCLYLCNLRQTSNVLSLNASTYKMGFRACSIKHSAYVD